MSENESRDTTYQTYMKSLPEPLAFLGASFGSVLFTRICHLSLSLHWRHCCLSVHSLERGRSVSIAI